MIKRFLPILTKAENGGGFGSGTLPPTPPQVSDDSRAPSVCSAGESFVCCVYFLAIVTKTGPLAGLFKLGIADCLPIRYRQLTQEWGEFDLDRSAVLWLPSRREAQNLETALHHLFGGVIIRGVNQAEIETNHPDGTDASGTWRRHPGRRGDGSTEFYADGCLENMLVFAENWLPTEAPK